VTAKTVAQAVEGILAEYLPRAIVTAVLSSCEERTKVRLRELTQATLPQYVDRIGRSVKLFGLAENKRSECLSRLTALQAAGLQAEAPSEVLVPIERELDILIARNAARFACRSIALSTSQEIKFATAISELARNIYQYAKTGTISISLIPAEGKQPPGVHAVAKDWGPGITNLNDILSGRYQSKSGMGLGLVGVRRLTDEFKVETAPNAGTTVTVRKYRD
jgi:serine/threonine-protein kinase RsbT